MDKRDAELFTDFCQFVWLSGNMIALIFDPEHEIYNSKGINFSSLRHLDAIGLISFEASSGYKSAYRGKYVQTWYFDQAILIEIGKDKGNGFYIGKVLFTQAGQELAPICGATRNNDFYEYVIEKWYKEGFILSTPLPDKASHQLPA